MPAGSERTCRLWLDEEDYKRMLNFLRKFQSYVPLSDIGGGSVAVRLPDPRNPVVGE